MIAVVARCFLLAGNDLSCKLHILKCKYAHLVGYRFRKDSDLSTVFFHDALMVKLEEQLTGFGVILFSILNV